MDCPDCDVEMREYEHEGQPNTHECEECGLGPLASPDEVERFRQREGSS